MPTGVAIAIPDGYAGFVLPRSGLALRHGVTVLNAPGLIDAGYRDELKVLLVNTDAERDYEIHRGDRIAQLVLQRVEAARLARGGRSRRREPGRRVRPHRPLSSASRQSHAETIGTPQPTTIVPFMKLWMPQT